MPCVITTYKGTKLCRFENAARELLRAMYAWERAERQSQTAFEQSVRHQRDGLGPALVPAFQQQEQGV
jgi:hypothetical protein